VFLRGFDTFGFIHQLKQAPLEILAVRKQFTRQLFGAPSFVKIVAQNTDLAATKVQADRFRLERSLGGI
jgi:hypothetical protein